MFQWKSSYERDKELVELNGRLIEEKQELLVELGGFREQIAYLEDSYQQRIRALETSLAAERMARVHDEKVLNEKINETIHHKNIAAVRQDALDDAQRSAGHIVGKTTQVNKKTKRSLQ